MVEDIARVVNVEEVLRRLHQRGAPALLEVREHVLQKVRMRLHVRVKDDADIVLLGRALREGDEFECVVDISRLAVDGQTRVLWSCNVNEPVIVHEHHSLLALEIAAVVCEVDGHARPLVAQCERGFAGGEDDIGRLGVARHDDVHVVARLDPRLDRGRQLVVSPRVGEPDHREHHHAHGAEHLGSADGGLIIKAVGQVPLDGVEPTVPEIGRTDGEEGNDHHTVEERQVALVNYLAATGEHRQRGEVILRHRRRRFQK